MSESGILRPLIVKKNFMEKTFLFEFLAEPSLTIRKEIVSEEEKSFPSKFHPSTLEHKIFEAQRIVVENPSVYKNIRDISHEVVLNPSYLTSKFKEITGMALKEFMRKIKLCNSLKEVISTDKPVKLIAKKYG